MIPSKYFEALDFIKQKTSDSPEIGIILGTGLGALAREIDIKSEISYSDIPHFQVSTVEFHEGRLLFGTLGNKQVVAMNGRFHYYEGYNMEQVTFPVRIMKLLGITHLFISNASGGLNSAQEISDLLIMKDHINLFPDSPLRGEHNEEFGPRFPDMSEPYNRDLIAKAVDIAKRLAIRAHVGVYAGVAGPALETPAEYEYIRRLGADAVGMSTIPENIVARQMGIDCFAISVITDLGIEGKIKKVTVEDVIAAAKTAEPGMTKIMKELIQGIQA